MENESVVIIVPSQLQIRSIPNTCSLLLRTKEFVPGGV